MEVKIGVSTTQISKMYFNNNIAIYQIVYMPVFKININLQMFVWP